MQLPSNKFGVLTEVAAISSAWYVINSYTMFGSAHALEANETN